MKQSYILWISINIFHIACQPNQNPTIMNKEEQIMIKSIYTNLMVNNVESTISFYETIGFKTVQQAPQKNPEWALVKKDNATLMFQSTSSLQKEFPQLKEQKMGVGLTLWIRVDNVEKYYDQIKDKTKIIKPLGITDYNGATEFVIQDFNGFILHFSNLEL